MMNMPQSRQAWFEVQAEVDGAWPMAEAYKAYCRDRLAELREVRVRGPIPPGVIPCFVVVHNEKRRLPALLAHYRALGVGRFVIVDHKSNDGTSNFLAAEPDVDVFRTGASYETACEGAAWITGLARRYAMGRWALAADADEHLVYDGMGDHDLHALVALLEGLGRKRLYAPMIDMYPRVPLAGLRVETTQTFLEACPYFDPIEANGRVFHRRRYSARGPVLEGGPRPRCFTLEGRPMDAYLPKHPLSFWEEGTLYRTVHHPYPYLQNVAEPSAALLHFKFLDDFQVHEQEQAVVGQAWQGGRYASARADQINRQPELSLFHPESRHYRGPESFLADGIISRLPWDRPSLREKTGVPDGKPESERRRRFLVIVRAGDQSLHPHWMGGGERRTERSWDLHISYCGDDPDPFPNRPADVTLSRAKGPKLAAIANYLDSQSALDEGAGLDGYDWFWFPDDDIVADLQTIERFFRYVETYNLVLAQPALHESSHMGHEITGRHAGSLLRFTNFVDVMCPCFSRAALDLCRPLFRETQSGRGLDFPFSRLAGYPDRGIAVVDAASVANTRPSGIQSTRAAGIDPAGELKQRHRLDTQKRTLAAVLLDGTVTVDLKSVRPNRPPSAVPRLSVVMAVGGDLRFLDEAVDSILGQDFDDFELIIVDDGSGAGAVFEKLAKRDPRIRLIVNPANLGLAVSLNRGIAEAKGDLIVRLDADDIAEPNRFGRLVDAFDADRELGLVGSWVVNIDETGMPVGANRTPETDLQIRWTILFYVPFCHSSVAFRRECFKTAGGYRNDLRLSEDHYLWAEMIEVTRARNIPESLVRFRLNPRGMSATAPPDWRARTHQIRERSWARLGIRYDLYNDVRADDIAEFVYGSAIARVEGRAAAYRTILTLLRGFLLQATLARDEDHEAARQLVKTTIARVFAEPPRGLRNRVAIARLAWRLDPACATAGFVTRISRKLNRALTRPFTQRRRRRQQRAAPR